MAKDATGRELIPGQLVDLQLLGMFHAIVVNVIEAPRVLAPGQQPFPPRIILQIMLEQMANQDGQFPVLYIVKDPPPKPKLEEASSVVDIESGRKPS